MGCFNSSGFISGLPIRYGDRVVCFIALGAQNFSFRELYRPDSMVAPFFLPIRGEYDDYGGVENIDRTHVVEMIEKYAGTGIENVLEGVERCIYGKSIQDNLNYWIEAKSKHENGECLLCDREIKLYESIQPLFSNTRYETTYQYMLQTMCQEHDDNWERYKKELDSYGVFPVLLMEHEQVYDQITENFMKPEKYDFFPSNGKRFNEFMRHFELVRKTYGKLSDENKARFAGAIPNLSGYNVVSIDSMMTYLRNIGNDERKDLNLSPLCFYLPHDSDSMELFDKFSPEDKFDTIEKDRDELRRFCILYHKFMCMPKFFSLSQCAGMQEFNYDLFEEVYDACQQKLWESKKEWESNTEDYLEEDENNEEGENEH